MSDDFSRFICSLPSGNLFLADMQHLRGYCILSAIPEVASINDLPITQRTEFLLDMALVGDTLMQLTGAYRINYAIFGNSQPILHAHIVPRFLSEPEEFLHNQPWSYPEIVINKNKFNLKRDEELMMRIASEIKKHQRIR